MSTSKHLGATASHDSAETRRATREWAASVGIPAENLIELGRGGIENMVAIEQCWALPGAPYFQGVNGHVSTVGALGAFASALSYGTAAYLVRGTTWVKVPKSIKIVARGQTRPGVTPRDVSEVVMHRLGASGAVGMVMEWTGDWVDQLSMGQRFGVCSQAIFTGAWTAIMNPDDRTLDYVRSVTDRPFDPLVSDADAAYARTLEIDVTEVEPIVVPPPRRLDVLPVSELVGTPVNWGFVGSEANAFIEDMRLVAGVLADRKVHPGVILNVTPGTVKVLREALDERLIDVLVDAECVIPTPCAGMDGGWNTPLAAGDVCIATGPANYPGRMGSTEAEIYLASPLTVAASCVAGKIVDPRAMLGS